MPCGRSRESIKRSEFAGRAGHGYRRQWIESTLWTLEGQLRLEDEGVRKIPGLATHIAWRLLALAAGISHTTSPGRPARAFAIYGR